MKMFFYMLLVWLLLISSSRILKAQVDSVNSEIKSHRQIKVCGSEDEKTVQVSVYLGEIKEIDSLFSFEVYLTYNPEKIVFLSALYVNTLSEFFDNEWRGFNTIEPGMIHGYAGASITGKQAVGNKSLIAFEGRYLTECVDTAEIHLNYIEIEASEKFDSMMTYNQPKLVLSIDKKNTNNLVSVDFLQDTLVDFREDSTAEVNVNLNTNEIKGVDSIDFLIKLKENDNLKIEEIKDLNENLIIDSIITDKQNDSLFYLIKTHLIADISDETVFGIKVKKLKKDNDTVSMSVSIKKMNECTCAGNTKNDDMIIMNEKDTTNTGVVENKFENKIIAFYDFINDEFNIDSENYGFKEIKIYNIDGGQVWNKIFSGYDNNEKVGTERFLRGVYLLKIVLMNGFEKNIVLIKN